MSEQVPFLILDATTKSFPKIEAPEPTLFITFTTPGEKQEPTAYLREFITVCGWLRDRHLVGLRIRNTENVQDNVIGISLRLRNHFEPMIWAYSGTSFKVEQYFDWLIVSRCIWIIWGYLLLMVELIRRGACWMDLHFLDSLNYLPMILKSMPESFDLTCTLQHCQ